MTASPTQSETYSEHLKSEGYVPQADNEGNILFKREGLTYILFASHNDPNYFRLVCPIVWQVETDEQRAKANQVISAVNLNIKAVKLFMVENSVSASSESFLANEGDYKAILPRSLAALAFGVQTFASLMNNPPPAQQPAS